MFNHANHLFGRVARAGAVVAVLAAGGQAMAHGGGGFHGGGFVGGGRGFACGHSGGWGGRGFGWCGPRVSIGLGFYGGCGYPYYSYGYPYGYYYPSYAYTYAAAPYADGAVVIPAATQTVAVAPTSGVATPAPNVYMASSTPSFQQPGAMQYAAPQAQARPQDRDLGDAYLRMGDPENAVRVYSRYLNTWSGDASVNRNYGFALIERGDMSRGFQAVLHGYQLDPDLIRRPLSADDFGGKQGFQRVLDAAAGGAAGSGTLEGWVSVAVLQHAGGQNEAALNVLQRARDAGLDKGLFDQFTRAFGGTSAQDQQQNQQSPPQPTQPQSIPQPGQSQQPAAQPAPQLQR